MTKIPVVYAYEEIWKVSENKEGKKMEEDRIIKLLVLTITVLSVVGIILAVMGICCSVSMTSRNSQSQAQCESIGGRYDGEACWYNGSKIDVNKYVEEWK